jgi:xylulokinase
MSLLAIDIGSSRCKGVLFSATGEILAQCSRLYAPEFSQPSFAEMDPDIFWQAVQAVSRSAASLQHQDLQPQDQIEAVCLSSHGETLIPVNPVSTALRSAILNIDTRAAEESAWCEEHMGRMRLFQLTGHTSHPMYPIAKLLWLRRHEPELFREAPIFLSVVSYILVKLGLPPYIDYSLASRYMAFDICNKCWSEEILSLLNLPKDCLPIPSSAGTIAGELSAEAAGILGLRQGTPMVLGGHDQACGSLGMGVIAPGRISDSMGTYECISVTSDQPHLNEKALTYNLNSYCHVLPGKFITLAYFPSGIMLQWFYDLLYPSDADDSGGSEEARYLDLESLAPEQPSGLLVLPYLIGTCNPDFNPHARGAILGLTRSSHRGDIYKGILEGVACELSAMTGMFERALAESADIYASGGGSRSPLGVRLRAAMSGRTFHLMSCPESVCLGGAILAAVAVGLYPSIPEAVKHMVREEQTVAPDEEMAEVYRPLKAQYAHLSSMLSALQAPIAPPLSHIGADAWFSQR